MDLPKVSLEGKVALITGSCRGIGLATALAFADAGANVAISCRKDADLEPVVKQIRAKGVKSLPVAAHVAKPEDLKNLVGRVKAEFGRIDILMNNAGTNPYAGTLIDAEEWAWDATMNVNLKGPFLLSQLVARGMREQGGGNIINISSTGGLRAGGLPIYGVTKAALIMLTQNMAREWGQYKIRVNAIAPGLTQTRFSEMLWKEPARGESAAKRTALGRLGHPDDIARVALFLASDLAQYITGETIIVDGGSMVGSALVS